MILFSSPKCRVCQNRHHLRLCADFLRMTVAERRNIVLQKSYCFNCLCLGHTSEWCRSRNRCEVCNRNHHTKLHQDDTRQRRNRQREQNRRSRSRSRTPVRPRSPILPRSPVLPVRQSPPSPTGPLHRSRSVRRRERSSRPSHSNVDRSRPRSISERLSIRSTQHIFLPTALARVLAPGGTDSTRLLLNSGAAQTIILKSLVDRVNLHTTHKEGKEFCTMNLQSFNDKSVKVQITGLVRQHLNTPLPEKTTDKRLAEIYNHIPDLADPNFHSPVSVEILLANDQMSKILKAGLIQTSTNMPIAQSTVFGWTISGACQI